MRIRTKLLVPFLVLPLGALALLGGITYRSGREAIEEIQGHLFELQALRGIDLLEREVASAQRSGEAWASLDVMQDVLADDIDGRISSFLVGQARTQDALLRAVVADRTGRVVAASHPEWVGSILPAAARGPDEAPRCHDEPASSADGGSGSGSAVTCLHVVRARFDEGQVVGTLSVSWDLVRLFATQLGRWSRQLTLGDGDLVLLRRDGLVVFAPPDHRDWLLRHNLVSAGSQAAVLATAGRRGFLVEAIDGKPALVGFGHSTGASGWSALVVQDARAAFAPVERLRDTVLGLGALTALLALILAPLAAARLTRPVRALERAVHRVEEGDLDVRLEPRSRDEIGSLTRSFDRMVQELRRQRAELMDKGYVDSLIAAMADGLFVVADDDVVRQANPSMRRLLGATAEDLVGRPVDSLFASGDAFRRSVLEPARAGRAVHEVEVELVRLGAPGSTPAIVSAALLPPREPGGRAEVVCIATDITHRKAAEEELRQAREEAETASRTKAEFLATLSHEVRTPLNGVLGMTDLLEGTSLDERQRGYLDTARRSAEALLAVFDDILDYSKMDAGRVELERVVFDLRACVEGAVEIVAEAGRRKSLEVSLLVEDGLPGRVVGDPGRLRQVLLNLGINGVKFTPAGGIAFRVSRAEGSRGLVRFSVSDTGIGVPAAARERLFEPFYQVDASATRRYGGTGLGLAIARRLVGLMNGHLDVQSEEGRGATFTFTAELPPVSEEGRPPAPPPDVLRGLRVLIVDDNATNRFVLREMLLAWKAVPEEAEDAWDALEKLREAAEGPEPFSLALVDFQMPERDGGQLAQDVKADPRLASLPLILLTSMPQHGEAARMMGLGFAAYLTKPVRQSILLETVARVLGPPPPRRSALSLVRGQGKPPGGTAS